MRIPCRILITATALCLLAPVIHGQSRPGPLTSYAIEGNAVVLRADTMALRVTVIADGTVRVDLLPSPSAAPESSLTVVEPNALGLLPSVTETNSSVRISAGAVTVTATKNPLRLSFDSPFSRAPLRETPEGGATVLGDLRWISFTLDPGTRIYGGGQRSSSLDLNGTTFDLYNTQVFNYGGPLPTMNANVPLFLFSPGYAVFIDHYDRGRFDGGVSSPDLWKYEVQGGELTYYVMMGSTWGELLDLYTRLTGRQPLPPRWALGYIQSKFGYQTETELRSVAASLRSLDIPCDALVIDLYWFEHMGDLRWYAPRWPDPARLLSDLRSDGFRTIAITEPYVVEFSSSFNEGSALSHFGRRADGQTYLLPNWWACSCNAALVDMTSAAARAWWWNKYPPFLDAGLAGLWTDLGEPENHPYDMVHLLGTARRVHNLYNLLWARSMAEGWQSYRPNERLFNLTRSGWAGIQRYSTFTWSADVSKSFGGLAVQPTIMLSASMSGLGFQHSDLGGFCCGTTPSELYDRWMQLGTFSPVMRAHGTGGPTEPWGFGEASLQAAREQIRLRYRFLPYLYTAAYLQSVSGAPIVRPLFWTDPEDPALANETRAFMVGDHLLVAPVLQSGATSVSFRLPAGLWYDLRSDAPVDGGRDYTAPAPRESLPVYVRAGSILPLAPVMRWSDERTLDTVTYLVYPHPTEAASGTMYEDDGVSHAYRTGALNLTSVMQQWATVNGVQVMTIDIVQNGGRYAGEPVSRPVIVDIRALRTAPLGAQLNGRSMPAFATWDQALAAGFGGSYDPSENRLRLLFTSFRDSSYRLLLVDPRLTTVANRSFPAEFTLEQNYPNPFNGATTISFTLSMESTVRLEVFDLLGRRVDLLAEGARASGRHTTTWDPAGRPGGLYVLRLDAAGRRAVRKMLYVP